MLVAAPHKLRTVLRPTEGKIASINNEPVNALSG